MLSSRFLMAQLWKLVMTKTLMKLTLSQKLKITNTSRLVMDQLCTIPIWFFGRPVVQTVRQPTCSLQAIVNLLMTANKITLVPLLKCLMELWSLNPAESWTQATYKIKSLLLVKRSICASPIEKMVLVSRCTVDTVSLI